MSDEAGEAIGIVIAVAVMVALAVMTVMAVASVGAVFGAGHGIRNYFAALVENTSLEHPEV